MLASGFQPTSVVMPSELTQNARQDAKNQLANEMKAFLQSQSQQNPRLRRLRVNQADVQTSITHPPMQSSVDSRSGPMSQFSDSAPQHGRRAAPGNGGRKPQPPPLPIGDSEALNDSQKKHFPQPPDHLSNQQPMSYQPQPPGNGYPGYPPRPK
jgi:hypothetical protein